MLKQLVSVLLAILVLTPHSNVGAQTILDLDRASFVHLTDTQKEKVIILIMEMMVEMESKYRTYAEVNGHNEELFKTYSSIMRKLQSFLIGEAHADAALPMEWREYAQSFSRSLADTVQPGDKCFFAGWVSRMKSQKAKGSKFVTNICAHPKDLDPTTLEYQSYQRSLKPRGCSPDKISCNPAIFGFRNSADKTAFCVFAKLPDNFSENSETPNASIDPNASHSEEAAPELSALPDSLLSTNLTPDSNNSSYNCMRLALDMYKEKPTKGKKGAPAAATPVNDTKEQRLQFLKQIYAESTNQEYLNSILSFTIKNCVCDNNQPSQLNVKYLEKIRPHRTCYGLMEMIGQIMQECVPENLKLAHEIELKFLTDLKNYTNGTGITIGNIDSRYKEQMKKIRKTNKDSYGQYCLGETPPAPPAPPVPPQPVKAKEYECKEVKFAENECTVEALAANPAAVDPVTDSGSVAATRSVSCKVFIYEKEHPDVNLMNEKVSGSEGQSKEVEFSTGADNEKAKINCTLPAAPVIPPVEIQATCKVELAVEGESLKASVTIGPEGKQVLAYMWKPEFANEASATYPVSGQDQEVSLSLDLKKSEGKETIVCTSAKHNGQRPDPKLRLELAELTDDKQKVNAKLEGDFAGWTINWFTKGEKKPKKSATTETRAPVARDSASEDAEQSDSEAEFKGFTASENAAEGASQNMSRHEEEYQICANLSKDDKKVSEDCRPVKKLEPKAEEPAKEVKEEKPEKVKQPKAAPFNPQMPMPQMMPRRSIHSHGGSL